MGVLERGWLGVFDVAVDPRLRGRGYGRRVMLHLLGWGKAQGALNAYLQVARENLPARKLYARLGFHTQYHYWYRQKRT
jgi:ribosomal protein S18 acetylase RimI-like enzyme